VPTLGHKNIGRLDVAMDNAFGVRGIQGVGTFRRHTKELIKFHRTSGNDVFQRSAVEKLHGDKRAAVVFTDVMNRADVRMIEGRRGLRLALKTEPALAKQFDR
jgi:hypothetical protein